METVETIEVLSGEPVREGRAKGGWDGDDGKRKRGEGEFTPALSLFHGNVQGIDPRASWRCRFSGETKPKALLPKCLNRLRFPTASEAEREETGRIVTAMPGGQKETGLRFFGRQRLCSTVLGDAPFGFALPA